MHKRKPWETDTHELKAKCDEKETYFTTEKSWRTQKTEKTNGGCEDDRTAQKCQDWFSTICTSLEKRIKTDDVC